MTKTEAKAGTFPSKAFAAQSATSRLGPFRVQRRTPRAEDVQIRILYCGVCNSDRHTVRNEWNAIMIAKEISSKRDTASGRQRRLETLANSTANSVRHNGR